MTLLQKWKHRPIKIDATDSIYIHLQSLAAIVKMNSVMHRCLHYLDFLISRCRCNLVRWFGESATHSSAFFSVPTVYFAVKRPRLSAIVVSHSSCCSSRGGMRQAGRPAGRQTVRPLLSGRPSVVVPLTLHDRRTETPSRPTGPAPAPEVGTAIGLQPPQCWAS